MNDLIKVSAYHIKFLKMSYPELLKLLGGKPSNILKAPHILNFRKLSCLSCHNDQGFTHNLVQFTLHLFR